MRRKMLKEEKAILSYCEFVFGPKGLSFNAHKVIKSRFRELTSALVRAVREDCARVAEGHIEQCNNDDVSGAYACEIIAAAIRGRK